MQQYSRTYIKATDLTSYSQYQHCQTEWKKMSYSCYIGYSNGIKRNCFVLKYKSQSFRRKAHFSGVLRENKSRNNVEK